MKALAILDKNMTSSVSSSFLNDPDQDCYPIGNLYYKISPEKLDVGVISKDNDFYLEANTFKFITYWENMKPTYSVILAQYCIENNIFMLNREFTIKNHELINDKFFQNKFFKNNGIPFLTITNTHRGLDTVLKHRKGSCGKDMEFVKQRENRFHNEPCPATHILHEFLKYDNDYRAIVLDGKCIGVIDRIPKENEFRANINLGGTAQEVDPDQLKNVELIAENTAKTLGSDYVGIDILRRGSEFYVLEVNFYASFNGFESIYGKNYVYNKIKNYLTTKCEK
jgi:glutathione synthase/RimK-type ligase-like ATP-grasp enzyme